MPAAGRSIAVCKPLASLSRWVPVGAPRGKAPDGDSPKPTGLMQPGWGHAHRRSCSVRSCLFRARLAWMLGAWPFGRSSTGMATHLHLPRSERGSGASSPVCLDPKAEVAAPKMNPVDLIRAKRDGAELTGEQIDWLVSAYTNGQVADYQMSAFLMATLWRGMKPAEAVRLTFAMVDSGTRLRLGEMLAPVADKHSTGGVGDKVTLVVAPLAAACGLPVGKMSGRGLGHTGGTIDKLESISGLRTKFTPRQFVSIVRKHGIAIAAQSSTLAPADGKLYALRDVAATVDSIPLIAASIMSKKLAIGPTHLLLDVKVGAGAFMKDEASARELAELMVRIGAEAGIRTVAFLTAMDQPLGCAVGNALEVAEAIALL